TVEKECWLTVKFMLAKTTSWANQGHMVSVSQLNLKEESVVSAELPTYGGSELEVYESDKIIKVKGKQFRVIFDKWNGYLLSWKYKEMSMIDKGPELDFWRAPIDNDLYNNTKTKSNPTIADWKEAKLHLLQQSIRTVTYQVSEDNEIVSIYVHGRV